MATKLLGLLLLPLAATGFTTRAPVVQPIAASSKTTIYLSSTTLLAEDVPEVTVPDVDVAVPAVPDVDATAMIPDVVDVQAAVDAIAPAVPDVDVQAAALQNLDVIALVVGQQNYGLAVVCLGEAIWSFSKAPTFDHALKTLGPALLAAGILGAVSGPMVTSGDASSVSTGLFIATGVSVGLGASYTARLLAPFSPSPKEIAALGLLVAVAGFFCFTQNLVVDGFVTLPSLPSVQLPSIGLPSIELPSIELPF